MSHSQKSEEISCFFLFFFVALYSVSTIELIFLKTLHQYNVIFCFFLVVLLYRHKFLHLKNILIYPIVIASVIFISSMIYDYSWDGQTYHQTAIIKLYQGWNPFYASNSLSDLGALPVKIWLKHYPKANWILAANFYLLTDFIETGKSVNFLFALICFGFVRSFFTHLTWLGTEENRFLKKGHYVNITSFAVVLSPVSLVQIMTFYVDSSLYYLTVGLITSLLLYSKMRDGIHLLSAVFFILLLVNIKFTGLAYALMTVILILAFDMLKEKKIDRVFILSTCTGIMLAVVLYGYNPYITNLLSGKHMLHPIIGRESIDVMGSQIDKTFHSENQFKKLFGSYFSKPSNSTKYPEPTFNLENFSPETYEAIGFDTRINGFGSIFPALLISCVLFFAANIKNIKNNQNIFIFMLITLAMTLINPALWWARIVPFFYLSPILLFLGSYGPKSKIKHFYISIVFFMITYNCANIIINSSRNSINYTIAVNKVMNDLRSNEINYISIDRWKNFTASSLNKLDSHEVIYQLIDKKMCEKVIGHALKNVNLCDMKKS